MAKTTYNIEVAENDKAFIFNILEKYDNVKGFDNFCGALSNLLKGSVTKQNLLDMCDCVTLIDENISTEFKAIVDKSVDDVYKNYKIGKGYIKS